VILLKLYTAGVEATINGLKIAYDDSGESHLPPLIFIHAFPLSRDMWKAQISALKGRARLICYDIRGFGASAAGDGQQTLEFFVDDLFALMDHLKLVKAALCGLSMGGYIALRAAERTPARISALVLCDTRSEADGNEAKIKRALSIKAVKQGGAAAFAETFVKAVFAPASLAEKPEAVAAAKKIIAETSPLGICGALLALGGRTDTTAALPAIGVPTLILVGEHDALTPPDAARALAKKIAGSELQIIRGAGHMSNLENPTEFNKRLSDFLAGL